MSLQRMKKGKQRRKLNRRKKKTRNMKEVEKDETGGKKMVEGGEDVERKCSVGLIVFLIMYDCISFMYMICIVQFY